MYKCNNLFYIPYILLFYFYFYFLYFLFVPIWDINYLETKWDIYIRMTKTGLTPYATDTDYSGDNKCRCKFCDKHIKNSDRLLNHERNCEITTFNILYKLNNGTLPKRPFTNVCEVITTNGNKPMNQIDIYEEFKSSPKVSQDTQTSNTFWDNENLNDDTNSDISNNEELFYNNEVFDENEIECIINTFLTDNNNDCNKNILFNNTMNNIDDLMIKMKSNMETQSKLYDEMLDEKKIITNDYVDKFDEFISDYSSDDEEPFYRVKITNGNGDIDYDFYTKNNVYVDTSIHNTAFFEWKSYATFDD